MEPSLVHSLIGNLGLHGDFSTQASKSVGTKQKNKNKTGVQIVINVNGVPSEKRRSAKQSALGTFKQGYHAVFLDNNQVYFGKMQRFADGAQFVTLHNVYYLHDITESAVLNFDLVKLGTEIHSPEDKMHINVDWILFWEKLRDDGPIVTAILNYKRNQ